MTPHWLTELPALWLAARADTALFCALVGIRHAEQGGPGREMGVLSIPAPTFTDQVRVARNSVVHQEKQYAKAAGVPARDATGYHTPAFLLAFSHHWAPVLNADNDPTGLNANHATNLATAYAAARRQVNAAVETLVI